jgi:uncharacterized membrane protein
MIIRDKKCKNRKFCIVLLPNRSISWPLLVRFYLFTCCVSFSIAGLFGFLGYWMVMPFSGLEMLLLGIGLYVTSRKSYQQEVINIDDRYLVLEKGCCKVQERRKFDRYWVKLIVEKKGYFREKLSLYLASHGEFVEIGKFLNNDEKESLVFEMNQGILIDVFYRQNEKMSL